MTEREARWTKTNQTKIYNVPFQLSFVFVQCYRKVQSNILFTQTKTKCPQLWLNWVLGCGEGFMVLLWDGRMRVWHEWLKTQKNKKENKPGGHKHLSWRAHWVKTSRGQTIWLLLRFQHRQIHILSYVFSAIQPRFLYKYTSVFTSTHIIKAQHTHAHTQAAYSD